MDPIKQGLVNYLKNWVASLPQDELWFDIPQDEGVELTYGIEGVRSCSLIVRQGGKKPRRFRFTLQESRI